MSQKKLHTIFEDNNPNIECVDGEEYDYLIVFVGHTGYNDDREQMNIDELKSYVQSQLENEPYEIVNVEQRSPEWTSNTVYIKKIT